MFHFLTTYRRFIIVLLTIVLAIPCSVKRDLKQQFHQQNTESTNNKSVKIGYTSFCSVYSESNKKQKSQTFRKAAFPYSSLYAHESIITADFIAPIIDNYHFYKEKIPTHIRNQQFLI